MPTAPLRLLLKNDLTEIARLSEQLGDFADRHALPQPVLFALNLALEELVTNIISHGFAAGTTHEIGVDIGLEGDRVTARIEDDGRPFDPTRRTDPDTAAPLDERAIGGLGVLLVRKMMDEMKYSYAGGRNILMLSKRVAVS